MFIGSYKSAIEVYAGIIKYIGFSVKLIL